MCSFSPTQNISHIFWNLKVHYHVQKKPPLVPVLKQINPVHTLPSYFFRTHSKYYPLMYTLAYQLISFLRISPSKPSMHLPCCHHVHIAPHFIALDFVRRKIYDLPH